MLRSSGAEESLDFLTFHPRNEKARLAFNDLAQNKDKLHEHHARYIVVVGEELLSDKTTYANRSEGETSDSAHSVDSVNRTILVGHFAVSFDRPAVIKGGKWVLGRGSEKKFGPNRNVDLLLADPSVNRATHGIATAHAILKMHPISGAWLLHTVEQSATQSKTDKGEQRPKSASTSMILNEETIDDGKFRALWKQSNTLEIAGLQFNIRYGIDSSEQEHRYLKERNTYLAMENILPPEAQISAIPNRRDVVNEWAFFRQGIGSGGNAAVWEGIDPLDGGLRAIKEITINSKRGAVCVRREHEAYQALSGSPSVVRLCGSTTPSMELSMAFDKFPAKVYFIMEMGTSFNQYRWQDAQPVD